MGSREGAHVRRDTERLVRTVGFAVNSPLVKNPEIGGQSADRRPFQLKRLALMRQPLLILHYLLLSGTTSKEMVKISSPLAWIWQLRC